MLLFFLFLAIATLLSRECAEQNGLQIGDTVIGKIWDPSYNNPEMEMELVGIFDIVADKEDVANMYNASSLWDFTEYAFCSNDATTAMAVKYSDGGGIEDAFFCVTNAAKLNSIIEEVRKISPICWKPCSLRWLPSRWLISPASRWPALWVHCSARQRRTSLSHRSISCGQPSWAVPC